MSVSGLTPGSSAVFFSVAREPKGYHSLVTRRQRVVRDDNGDGIAALEIERGVPRKSVWAVVDLISGTFAVATPEDYPLMPAEPSSMTVSRGIDATIDRLQNHRAAADMIIVRPGTGAWYLRSRDGGEEDEDRAGNGTVSTRLTAARNLSSSGPSLEFLVPGDVVIMIDPDHLTFIGTRVVG